MTTLAPVSVALKFGFVAVLYLFVLWVARSARRDLRRDDALLADRPAEAMPVASGGIAAGAARSSVAGPPAPRSLRALRATQSRKR